MPSRRIRDDAPDRNEGPRTWRTVPRPTDWAARVAAVLARDVVCQWRDNGRLCGSVEHLEVDHIGDPTDHDLASLRALCRRHHRRRTGQQGAAARQAKRIPRSRPPERHPGLL